MDSTETDFLVSINSKVINKNVFKANLGDNWVGCRITPDEFQKAIIEGWAYSAVYRNERRSRKNFLGTNIASVDIDGTRQIDDVLADPFCLKCLTCLYTTSSHTVEEHRFRLVFLLPMGVEDPNEYTHILQALSLKLGGDRAATDPARIFYGNRSASFQQWDRRISEEDLSLLLETYPVIEHKVATSTSLVTSLRSPKKLSGDMTLVTKEGNVLTLDQIRKRQSVFCPFHPDKHPSAFVGIKREGGKYVHCSSCQTTWHQHWDERLLLDDPTDFSVTIKNVSEMSLRSKRLHIKKIISDLSGEQLHQVSSHIDINIVETPFFKLDHIKDGLTLIKSQKGTGKTEAVSNVISDVLFARRTATLEELEERESDDDHPPQKLTIRSSYRVLLIGHRQALIRSLCKRLQLNCYLDEDAELEYSPLYRDQYGVCIDSIYKVLKYGRPYDLVIIDESEQVIGHFLAETMRDRFFFFKGFSKVIKEAKSVVAMDADLSWTTYLVLSELRNQTPKKRDLNGLSIFINEYKGPTKVIEIYESQLQLIGQIWSDIRDGKKLFICSNSKNKIEYLDQQLTKDFPDIKSISITSENSTKPEVQAFISDIRKACTEYQIILTSPSLGTGVDISFEDSKEVFDCVYGIFETLINTHFEVDQQLSRVRHPKRVCVWISPRRFNFEHNYDVVKKDLLEANVIANGAFTLANSIASAAFFDKDKSFLNLAALVVSDQMKSKNHLRSNFIQYKRKLGWKIEYIGSTDLREFGKQIKASGKQLSTEMYIDKLLSATPIDESTFEDIADRLDSNFSQEEISEAEMFSYRRIAIELFYREPISREIIIRDDFGYVRQVFRRFERVIQESELDEHRYTDAITSSGQIPINEGMKFYRDRKRQADGWLIYILLRSAGVLTNGVFDCEREITSLDLDLFVQIARSNKAILEMQLDRFQLRADIEEKPTQQLGVLLKMIGLELKRSRTSKLPGDKKLYHYRVDANRLAAIQQIQARQSTTDDAWREIHERYGFERISDDYHMTLGDLQRFVRQAGRMNR